MDKDLKRLEQLLNARHPCIWIPGFEEADAMALIRELAMSRATPMRVWTTTQGLCEGTIGDGPAVPDTEHPAAALYHLCQHAVSGLDVMIDLSDHLEDPKIRRLTRELIERHRSIRGHLILVDHNDQLPNVLSHEATRFELSLPDEKALVELLIDTVRLENNRKRVEAKISRDALNTIVRNLRGLTRRQAEQIVIDVISDDHILNDQDINRILVRKRQVLHKNSLLEYVEAPVDLHEIAGLGHLKKWLRQRRNATGQNNVLAPPRGILMLGVPGAGKSLCAKAIATAWRRPLLRLDPSTLYDRYVGESERKLREALQQAESMAPIVLWIDEIEKGFASAATRSTDGGLSQRMFGTLLTWMQENQANVFLFATANNIDALPAELLRKGRFDEIFFVDLPKTQVRKDIFSIHLAKRRLEPKAFDLAALAEASEGHTGSEIEQAIISAIHDAVDQKAKVSTQHVLDALAASPPISVTMREYVQRIRDWASGRCVLTD